MYVPDPRDKCQIITRERAKGQELTMDAFKELEFTSNRPPRFLGIPVSRQISPKNL